jgi:RNA polymerase sigma-70 factor (ECF subfamily)
MIMNSHPVAADVGLLPSFTDFYDRNYRSVLALARAVTGSWNDAEDLTQEAFSATFRNWRTVAGYDEPLAFVRRVVMNRSVSRWRKLGNEARAMARLGARPARQDAGPVFDDEFWSAVRSLPRRQAQVVTLFYVEDMSIEQIADVLDLVSGTVKTSLFRARQALAERLGGQRDEAPADRTPTDKNGVNR